MNTKALWTMLAFVAWSAGSTYWYVCEIKGFCNERPRAEVRAAEEKHIPATAPVTESENSSAESSRTESSVETASTGWLYFPHGSVNPVIGDSLKWNAFVKELASQASDGKKLRITGYYLPDEALSGKGESLGLMRARALGALLASSLDTTLFTYDAVQRQSATGETVAVNEEDFKWINENRYVQEKRDKVLIYFPFASDKEIRTPEILAYLDELAAELKQNPGLKVEITGYTDNIGRAESNKWWGMQRAKRVAALLRKRGVPTSQMIVKSGGEENPIADNATAEGRRLNRRVEIKKINS